MDIVEVHLFGAFRLQSGGQALTAAVAEKARALLAFLALEGTRPRTTLSALLWPYLSQEAAFDSLRKTLYRLRLRLEESKPGTADLFVADRHQVQLDLERVVVDALTFQSLLAECERHAHSSLGGCDECLARLA